MTASPRQIVKVILRCCIQRILLGLCEAGGAGERVAEWHDARRTISQSGWPSNASSAALGGLSRGCHLFAQFLLTTRSDRPSRAVALIRSLPSRKAAYDAQDRLISRLFPVDGKPGQP